MSVWAARVEENKEIGTALFKRFEPPLPVFVPSGKGWRPRVSDQMALNVILFVSRTGILWEKSRKIWALAAA